MEFEKFENIIVKVFLDENIIFILVLTINKGPTGPRKNTQSSLDYCVNIAIYFLT
jgi:hypothetical protein